jgi:hypothetical protein
MENGSSPDTEAPNLHSKMILLENHDVPSEPLKEHSHSDEQHTKLMEKMGQWEVQIYQ